MDFPYEEASVVARDLVQQMAPACFQIEIAGSLRRRSQVVHDVEIVAEPIMEVGTDLFGNGAGYLSRLDAVLDALLEDGVLRSFPGAKKGERFRQFTVAPLGIKLDLFIVRPPAQWGSILAIRTGPAHYSHWLVTPRKQGGAMPSHLQQRDGAVWDGEALIPTPTEAAFFDLLGFDAVPEPSVRVPRWRGKVDDPY